MISEYEEPMATTADGPAIAPLIRGGALVELRRHHPSNLEAFQNWYADEEIARMLRHDQRPLNEIQSRGYFTSIIMPATARESAYAIHERLTGRLIGATALTDFEGQAMRQAFFRIVIGEKDAWGRGFGTEATRLVVLDGFERHKLDLVKLEVFRQNLRARNTYERIGFRVTGEHTEYVGRDRFPLHVIEMEIDAASFESSNRAWLARIADV
ncbi:MAG: GNAT family N-acetyltransferase [Thermomicrobiales bacterium]|nr:GNAT family N-acetyltransferase [Thermomicrobiales bacterium]